MKSNLIFLFNLILTLHFFQQSACATVMSIDLGNEFMKIAIVKPGVPMEIVLNKESRRKTPIAVSLKSIEREYGEPALSQAIKHPKTAYFYLKDLLGKSLNNPLVKSFQERYPYYNIKENEKTKTIYFQHDSETTYSPEELVAMILDNAREIASEFAEQPIDAAVITVPPYFTQAERKALLRAADLAKLKVLQLINSNTAAALNYGVFRRKDFNTSGTTLMFYDMGSSGAVATIVTYHLVKTKDDTELNPQLTVRGVGFDRTLGGNQLTYRLMKHLADKFQKEKKKNVYDYPKAILKLYKEAERVKTVLSANNDHFAQVEGLIDDIDFKAKVTREEFESICVDLFDRVKKPILDAINSAGITLEEIESVILVGGSTRVPKIQDELLKATKKSELGKSLNTDEASALGAVYQAAFQSKGFKVKKFLIKDLNIYPLVVDFERQSIQDEIINDSSKIIRRVLYDRNCEYPKKKTLTLNKHDSDFVINLNYGDISAFDKNTIDGMGSLNITEVLIKGVKDTFEKHANDISKGLRVHFNLDDSGVLRTEKVDISFEKQESEKTAGDNESTFSKIGNKISSFFSGGSKTYENENENTNEEKDEPTKPSDEHKEETQKDTTETKTDTPSNTTFDNSTNKTDFNETESQKNKTDTKSTPSIQIVKENVQFEIRALDIFDLSESDTNEINKKFELLKEKEKEKRKRASAINALETFIYDTKFKLEENDFIKCSTKEERENIGKKLDETNDWLFDTDDTVETKQFKEKLNELKTITKDVYFRINERKNRKAKLDELKEYLNGSLAFLETTRNLTGEDKPFTQVEVKSLEKLINETRDWRTNMMNEQAKLADHEQPKLLTADINEKIELLRREINYLITKAKYFRPKQKTDKDDKTNKTKTEENQQNDKQKSDENIKKNEDIPEEEIKKSQKEDETKRTDENKETPSPEL